MIFLLILWVVQQAQAVWRKRGSNSSEREWGFSNFVPRIKCSESPACRQAATTCVT